MIRLGLDGPEGPSRIRSRIANIYDRIAGGNDYQRNENSLGQIQFCVITLSAVATGGVNAFAHQERIGWIGASVLALLILGFVEKFYFTLRHGLMTVYKSRKQRFAAGFCYRTLQISMTLNAMILCAWVTGIALPGLLKLWNHWALSIHFGLALVGVSAVRDYDMIAENRIREMKAEAAEQDILAIRRAAAGNHPLLLFAAWLRGWLDGMRMAFQLLRGDQDKPRFSGDFLPERTDDSQTLYLPPEGEENVPGKVTRISGKRPRR